MRDLLGVLFATGAGSGPKRSKVARQEEQVDLAGPVPPELSGKPATAEYSVRISMGGDTGRCLGGRDMENPMWRTNRGDQACGESVLAAFSDLRCSPSADYCQQELSG